MAYAPGVMYCEFSGRNVTLREVKGRVMVRRFLMRDNVIQAVVQGDGANALVAITMANGRTDIYSWTGSLVRRG